RLGQRVVRTVRVSFAEPPGPVATTVTTRAPFTDLVVRSVVSPPRAGRTLVTSTLPRLRRVTLTEVAPAAATETGRPLRSDAARTFATAATWTAGLGDVPVSGRRLGVRPSRVRKRSVWSMTPVTLAPCGPEAATRTWVPV